MKNIQQTIHLSAAEAGYVSTLMREDTFFRSLLLDSVKDLVELERVTLRTSQARSVRDYLTDRLVRVGFDENYEPNWEGKILESLTDKLFLPG